MFCPNCHKEFENAKFCPECGTKLVERGMSGKGLFFGDANAIAGDLKIDNSTSTISHITNITNKAALTEPELKQLKEKQLQVNEQAYRKRCAEYYQDGILTPEEKRKLEEYREELGLDKDIAEHIMDSIKELYHHARLTFTDETAIREAFQQIESNNVKALGYSVKSLRMIAQRTQNDKVFFVYYMLLAALCPSACVADYKRSDTDIYWRDYWTVFAMLKVDLYEDACRVLYNKLPRYTENGNVVLAMVVCQLYIYRKTPGVIKNLNAIYEDVDKCDNNLDERLVCVWKALIRLRAKWNHAVLQDEYKCSPFYSEQLLSFLMDPVTPIVQKLPAMIKIQPMPRDHKETWNAEKNIPSFAKTVQEVAVAKLLIEEGKYRDAQDFLYQSGDSIALNYKGNPDDASAYGSLLCALSMLYVEMGDYNESMKMAKAALDIFQKLSKGEHSVSDQQIAEAWEALGNSYLALKEWNESTDAFREAKESYAKCEPGLRDASLQRIAQKKINPSQEEMECESKSLLKQGEALLQREENVKAAVLLRKASEYGNASAQNLLAGCYRRGLGIGQDLCQAFYWYQKSANKGNPSAQYNLGLFYLKGYGIERDENAAVYWFRKSTEQDNSLAQDAMGNCCYQGIGMRKDEEEAVKWYRKAAQQGNGSAMYSLGVCYINGQGVRKNLSSAKEWLERAANLQDKRAVKLLNMIK